MKFIVDNNVGRLAGWLRALGYDTLFINPIADSDLVAIAQHENRVVLTRDTGVMRRRAIASGEVGALFIEGDDWRHQLAQVVAAFELSTTLVFKRCMACNALLQERSREEAQPHVPPYVYETQPRFLVCPGCGRYFWQGTHWQRIQQDLAAMLN